PSFPREYNLLYGYGTGNLFLEHQLEEAIAPQEYEPPDWHIMEETIISLGIDPGYALSKFAYVVSGLIDGKVHVLEAAEFDKAGEGSMIEKMVEVLDRY